MSQKVWGEEQTQFFYEIDPVAILGAAETFQLKVTGKFIQCPSMENRVYEIELSEPVWFDYLDHETQSVVAKFYRPGRWSKEQILEEHEFLLQLQERDIPAVAPLSIDGETLFKGEEHQIYFCLFPKIEGRSLQELSDEQFEILGRLLARVHDVGAISQFNHRVKLDIQNYGYDAINFLEKSPFVPPEISNEFIKNVQNHFDQISPLLERANYQRVHGDCHLGNLIWTGRGFYVVDFDDACLGPIAQDLWLLFPGIDEDSLKKRAVFLEGYQSMRPFDSRELSLVEPLRSIRLIHYNAWIGRRWEDPAFKKSFPQYDSIQYWHQLNEDIKRQVRSFEQILTYSHYDQ